MIMLFEGKFNGFAPVSPGVCKAGIGLLLYLVALESPEGSGTAGGTE